MTLIKVHCENWKEASTKGDCVEQSKWWLNIPAQARVRILQTGPGGSYTSLPLSPPRWHACAPDEDKKPEDRGGQLSDWDWTSSPDLHHHLQWVRMRDPTPCHNNIQSTVARCALHLTGRRASFDVWFIMYYHYTSLRWYNGGARISQYMSFADWISRKWNIFHRDWRYSVAIRAGMIQ